VDSPVEMSVITDNNDTSRREFKLDPSGNFIDDLAQTRCSGTPPRCRSRARRLANTSLQHSPHISSPTSCDHSPRYVVFIFCSPPILSSTTGFLPRQPFRESPLWTQHLSNHRLSTTSGTTK
jgi:hypothetical protein